MKLFYVLLSAGLIGAIWCLAELIIAAVTAADCHEQNEDTEDV